MARYFSISLRSILNTPLSLLITIIIIYLNTPEGIYVYLCCGQFNLPNLTARVYHNKTLTLSDEEKKTSLQIKLLRPPSVIICPQSPSGGVDKVTQLSDTAMTTITDYMEWEGTGQGIGIDGT